MRRPYAGRELLRIRRARDTHTTSERHWATRCRMSVARRASSATAGHRAAAGGQAWPSSQTRIPACSPWSAVQRSGVRSPARGPLPGPPRCAGQSCAACQCSPDSVYQAKPRCSLPSQKNGIKGDFQPSGANCPAGLPIQRSASACSSAASAWGIVQVNRSSSTCVGCIRFNRHIRPGEPVEFDRMADTHCAVPGPLPVRPVERACPTATQVHRADLQARPCGRRRLPRSAPVRTAHRIGQMRTCFSSVPNSYRRPQQLTAGTAASAASGSHGDTTLSLIPSEFPLHTGGPGTCSGTAVRATALSASLNRTACTS